MQNFFSKLHKNIAKLSFWANVGGLMLIIFVIAGVLAILTLMIAILWPLSFYFGVVVFVLMVISMIAETIWGEDP